MRVFQPLRKGDKGHEVFALQAALPAWTWGQAIIPAPDGSFGAQTQAAVRAYQEALDLPADGIAGRATCVQLGIWADVVPGIDVSHYQGEIDWQAVASSGVEIAYSKASEGKTHRDRRVGKNNYGSWSAGLLRGCYHRALANHSAEAEARNFIETVRDLPCNMPPSLDVEDNFTRRGAAAEDWIVEWCDHVESALDLPEASVLLYLSERVARKFGIEGSARLSRYRGWVPRYGPQPKTCLPFDNWSAWQHSAEGSVPGINARVDLNHFVARDFA